MNIFGDLTVRPMFVNPAPPVTRGPGGHADFDSAIKTLWALKLDTHAIAERLRVHQHVVANRLASIRDEAAR